MCWKVLAVALGILLGSTPLFALDCWSFICCCWFEVATAGQMCTTGVRGDQSIPTRINWTTPLLGTSREEWKGCRLTSPVHLPLDRLHAPGLLDDVVDELRGLLVPHLIFADAGLRQQLPQVGVQVVGIPADVTDMPGGNVVAELKRQNNHNDNNDNNNVARWSETFGLQPSLESTGRADVRFGELGVLFLVLVLVLLVFLSLVAHNWCGGRWRDWAISRSLYVWVLDVHRGHVEWTRAPRRHCYWRYRAQAGVDLNCWFQALLIMVNIIGKFVKETPFSDGTGGSVPLSTRKETRFKEWMSPLECVGSVKCGFFTSCNLYLTSVLRGALFLFC